MQCGFYEADINPPIGSIIPGGFAARYSTDIADGVHVRAFYVQDGAQALAVAVLDACGITLDITERIRACVCERLPLRAQDVMVMATHTHAGGPTLDWGEEVRRDGAYLAFIVQRTADAIWCAAKRARDAVLFAGSGRLHDVSFVRVYRMKDGGLRTNPGLANAQDVLSASDTPDTEVGVLLVRCGGRPVGALVNFACHPAIVTGTENSGDFIGVLASALKQAYGADFVTLLINGACGDINHLNVFDEDTFRPGREVVIGQALAKKVCEIAEQAARMEQGGLQSARSSVTVRLRKPEAVALAEAGAHLRALGDALPAAIPNTPGYVDTFFALQALWAAADKRVTREIELQALRIGEVNLLGCPGQMFTAYGRRVKAACGPHVFFVSFANDYAGYVPTPACMVPGVYEARLAQTSALEPAAGDIICDGLIGLHAQMESAR